MHTCLLTIACIAGIHCPFPSPLTQQVPCTDASACYSTVNDFAKNNKIKRKDFNVSCKVAGK